MLNKRELWEKKYYLENKDKILSRNRKYKLKNKSTITKKFKDYYHSNEGKEYFKDYYQANKIKLLNQNKDYRMKNRYKINKQKSEYLKSRYLQNKNYNLVCRLRSQFYNRIKGRYNQPIIKRDSLGIDWNIIIKSLGKLPKDIDNYHIDHIVPLSRFNFFHVDGSINHTEIRKAFSPGNLRLIKSKENMQKGRKVDLKKYPLRLKYCLK